MIVALPKFLTSHGNRAHGFLKMGDISIGDSSGLGVLAPATENTKKVLIMKIVAEKYY